LIEVGAVFNGSDYAWDTEAIGPNVIPTLNDLEFGALIERIKLWKDRENLKIAFEERLARIEQDKQDAIAAENKKIQDELAAKQAEQAEKEQKLKDAQDKLEEEKREIQKQKEIAEAKENSKIEAEKRAEEDRIEEKAKHDKIIAAAEQKAIDDENRHAEELEAARVKAIEDEKAAATQKEKDRITAEKKKAAAKEKAARLAPDKEKLFNLVLQFENIGWPALKTPEGDMASFQHKKIFEDFIEGLKDSANSL